MKLTKYDHACFTLQQHDQLLVVDPGIFSPSFSPLQKDISAVVITHQHSDHINPDIMADIIAANIDVALFAPQDVAAAFPDIPFTVIAAGDQKEVGPFSLVFTGGQHAMIHQSIPHIENVGVLINERIYYPGDSLVNVDAPVSVLLAPAAAPWLKISEAIDFIHSVRAPRVIPTHDAILSPEGKQVHDRMLREATDHAGGSYQRLEIGHAIEL